MRFGGLRGTLSRPHFAWPNPGAFTSPAGPTHRFLHATPADDAPFARLSVSLSGTSPPHQSQRSERPYFPPTWRRLAWRGAIRYVSASCTTAWGATNLWTSRTPDDTIDVWARTKAAAPPPPKSTIFLRGPFNCSPKVNFIYDGYIVKLWKMLWLSSIITPIVFPFSLLAALVLIIFQFFYTNIIKTPKIRI